jgi:hypothetical protein
LERRQLTLATHACGRVKDWEASEMTATTPAPARLDAHAKALAINLDPTIYGSIAEIGAGQEVARWFLTVGAASGTIAQTISAYDKTFSDCTYGAGTRYVSKERLLAMLDHEYRQLGERLGPTRGTTTRFFAFAGTASARNYKGDNEQHAWVGIRFQVEPGAESSDILLHVNLTAPTALLQQQVLGLLGVNLVHAAFHRRSPADDFLAGLWDEMAIELLEIDALELRGPAFAGIDARACCLGLVRRGMAQAIVFDATGQVAEPSGVLRRRPVIVERGRFAMEESFSEAMHKASDRHLRSEGIPLGRDSVVLQELSLNPLWGDSPNDEEVLKRLGKLAVLGAVAVTNFRELYRLADYLRRFTAEPIRLAMDVSQVAQFLSDRISVEQHGPLLENLGKLIAAGVRVYAYPMPAEVVRSILGADASQILEPSDSGVITADHLHPPEPVQHLYRYLRDANWVIAIGNG